MRTLIEALAVTAGIFGAIFALSYSGFCLERFGYLSDSEFIDAAIDEVMKTRSHVFEEPGGGFMTFGIQRQLPYKDREEFRRLNPDCCRIVPRGPDSVTLTHRLWGQAAKSVHVRYKVNYFNDNGILIKLEAVARRAISNCGRVLNTGH